MYWKNITALKELLKQGELPQKMQMWYLLITIGLYALFGELSTYFTSNSNPDYLDYIGSISYILILAFSIIYSYIANGKESGKYFTQRYISISFVVTFRYVVLIFIPLVLSIVIVSAIMEEIYGVNFFDTYIDIISLSLDTVLELIMMISIIKHIKDIADETSV